jgi:hypothetical protein
VRRFVTSLTGKLFSHFVVVALAMSFLTTSVVVKAYGQVQTLPAWAVTEFFVPEGQPASYGIAAAEAVTDALSNTGQYQLTPETEVNQEITHLGLASPLRGQANLLRVAQELRVGTIVRGDVAGVKFETVSGGRQARVAVRVVAYNSASGLPVNGAAVEGLSTVRTGTVQDASLVNEAIQAAAANAVHDIQQKQLPSATVLNTLVDRCYINQGSRAGFTDGQQVVLTRGRLEVATGRIADLEPDEAAVIIERQELGVTPGDRVQAIFSIPDIPLDSPFTPNGDLRTRKPAHVGNNAGLVSLAVLVGLGAFLLGSGGTNSLEATAGVSASAILYPPQSFGPEVGVKITWTPNGYSKGTSQKAAWQVWRNDQTLAPVVVVQGDQDSGYDLVTASGLDTQYTLWSTANGLVGGGPTAECFQYYDDDTIPTTLASPIPGTPYIYSVELVYAVSSIDLPISQSGTSTSTTSTSTSTTSTSTSTTSTSGETCYFISSRQNARGAATPLPPPTLQLPGSNAQIEGSQSFQWLGSSRAQAIEVTYILEFSTSPTFPASSTFTFGGSTPTLITAFNSGGSSGALVSIPALNLYNTATTAGLLPVSLQSAPQVFWRVGAKATADVPGPYPDPYTGQRYIFCLPSFFKPPASVPGLPTAKKKATTNAKKKGQ